MPELRMHGNAVAVSKKVVHGSTLKTDTTQDEQVNMRSISATPSALIEMSVPEPADARIAVVRLPLSGLRSTKDGFLEFLEKEQSKSGGQTAPAVVKRKLDYAFSIGVSTDSRTVERLNIEAGVSYPLNKRLLVYSGISLGSFGTEQQLPDQATFEKSTKLVRADLNGITIPVEVEYRPNEHIFFKGGMSASLITKHHGTLSYNEKISSFQSFSDAEGNMQIKEVVIDKPVSEEITDANFTPSRPVLFYNLSAGYRIPLFTSARIAMEPYLRVPVTSYGEYKLNLFQGGLKFRLDF
ncbi:outer membrane beta-barrel protein [Pedobacter psychrodurus]|nr:outer membrane beta-barrel protein [Pedobacter psychrodurus]